MANQKMLYHYCSNAVLESVIRNGQLWMCDITNSNDYSEIRLFLPDIFYDIEELYKQERFRFKYEGKSGIEALRRILSQVDNYINGFYHDGTFTSFVACFCEQGDVLSQWRGYSDDGRGCSIGFSQYQLKRYCDMSDGLIALEKVEYVSNEKLIKIRRVKANDILSYIKGLRRKSEIYIRDYGDGIIDLTEELMFIFLLGYTKRTLIHSLKYKREAFGEELEWRMFFTSITKNEDLLFNHTDKSKDLIREFDQATRVLEDGMDFTVKNDRIVSYYPVSFDRFKTNPIKKVYIGPKNNTRKKDMELFLAKYNIKRADVEYSKISYC